MCMNIYRHIDRRKVQFDFVKHTHSIGSFESEILSLGGRIYEAPRFKPGNILRYQNWWKRHFKLHLEHQIIHGHFFSISAVYFRIAKLFNRTTIGHIHASRADGVIKNILEKQISRQSDYRLSCSVEAGKWIYGNKPFRVINNAIDIDHFQFNPLVREIVRKEFSLQNTLTLGTVANFSSVKNPFGLIGIFANVIERRPEAKLLWIGEGGLREEIEKEINRKGLEQSIILLGKREDVSELLQAMDAFLLPSYNEGLPVSVIEAQASGLHCFISDRITKDVDITGLCHFLSIESPEIWVKTILECDLHHSVTLSQIQKAGYDINDTALKMQEFYLSIINK